MTDAAGNTRMCAGIAGDRAHELVPARIPGRAVDRDEVHAALAANPRRFVHPAMPDVMTATAAVPAAGRGTARRFRPLGDAYRLVESPPVGARRGVSPLLPSAPSRRTHSDAG